MDFALNRIAMVVTKKIISLCLVTSVLNCYVVLTGHLSCSAGTLKWPTISILAQQ